MSLPAIMYFARTVGWLAVAALIGSVLVSALRLLVQVLYGHNISESIRIAAWFFVLSYLIIWISTSVASVLVLLRKIRKAGVTVDYISRLSPHERMAFEKKHGF